MDNGDTSPVKQEESRDSQGRFVPGVSGNPNGRPTKEKIISDVLLKMLRDKPELISALATTLLELSLKKKDMVAIKEVLDRLEGRTVQRNELTGEDGGDIVINLVKYGDKTSA
jgi:hypothetical protein